MANNEKYNTELSVQEKADCIDYIIEHTTESTDMDLETIINFFLVDMDKADPFISVCIPSVIPELAPIMDDLSTEKLKDLQTSLQEKANNTHKKIAAYQNRTDGWVDLIYIGIHPDNKQKIVACRSFLAAKEQCFYEIRDEVYENFRICLTRRDQDIDKYELHTVEVDTWLRRAFGGLKAIKKANNYTELKSRIKSTVEAMKHIQPGESSQSRTMWAKRINPLYVWAIKINKDTNRAEA